MGKRRGRRLTDADSKEGVETYLNRNPGLSLVARQEGQIVGAILGGHDGRRGYLHRRWPLPRNIAGKASGPPSCGCALHGLRHPASRNADAWVYQKNEEAQAFWRKIGWS